jgi:hypothetical protein
MLTESRTTDAKARLVLPKSFANATVIMEQVRSETEIRVRRAAAAAVAEGDLPYAEESSAPLSDRDRDRFLDLLANPPAATVALKKAAARHKARRAGSS